MKNYKKGFVGIVMVVIVAAGILGFGTYQLFQKKSPVQRISEQMILNALNENGGGCITEQGVSVPYTKGSRGFGCSSDVTTLYAGDFHYGDINNDGFDDVIFSGGSCGASCGNSLMVGLNQKNGTIKLAGITPKAWITSGAAQSSLKNITITDGIISISANGYSDSKNWDDIITKKFKFENDKLIEIKSSISSNIDTSDWKTYRNEEYKFEIEVPVRWKIDDTLTKTICCLDLFSSMEPYDNDRLETGVTKIQFQNLFNTKSGSKEQFIQMGLEDKEMATLIISKDSIMEIENKNGLKILKFGSAISKNSYFIAKNSDFSEGLLVFVWGEEGPEVKSIISSFKFTK